jgi:hypothetical protein
MIPFLQYIFIPSAIHSSILLHSLGYSLQATTLNDAKLESLYTLQRLDAPDAQRVQQLATYTGVWKCVDVSLNDIIVGWGSHHGAAGRARRAARAAARLVHGRVEVCGRTVVVEI